MLKRVIYSFDDEDPPSLHPRKIEEVHTFLNLYRLPHERLDPKAINHTAEQKADPHYRGWRALNRIEASAFMRQDVDAFLAFAEVIIGRARMRLAELRLERDEAPRDAPSLKAYDGMIDAIQDSIARAHSAVSAMKDDLYEGMRTATESDRHA